MSVEMFHKLLKLVERNLEKQIAIRRPLSSELRLAVTLHFLAHGGSILNSSWMFLIGKSTAYQVIEEVCKIISNVLRPLYVKWPTREEWIKIADEYERKWNFPNCLGALDGKHIQIKKPSYSGSAFRNYNKYDSVVLMACCDANSRFIWYNIGDFGSYSDSSPSGNNLFAKPCQNLLKSANLCQTLPKYAIWDL